MLNLQSVYFGQKHKDFDYKDMDLIKKVRRLARKHQSQCENDCNGSGIVAGQMYYTGYIDDYAQKQYGPSVKPGYIDRIGDRTVFYAEIMRLEDRINDLLDSKSQFTVIYQRDPRGATVKLSYNGSDIAL